MAHPSSKLSRAKSGNEQGQNEGICTPGEAAPPVQRYLNPAPARQQAILHLQTLLGCDIPPFTSQMPEDEPDSRARSLKRRSRELEGSREQSKRRSRPDLEASLGSPEREREGEPERESLKRRSRELEESTEQPKRRSRPDLEDSLGSPEPITRIVNEACLCRIIMNHAWLLALHA